MPGAGAGPGSVSGDTDWQRLHPLSAIVRGGRATIAVVVVILPSLVLGERSSRTLYDLIGIGVVTALSFVSWLVTRWRIEDDDLRIETGLLRRHSERYPLAQLQAIDIVRPGLARVVGVAELRLRMGGATGGHARLAYLHEREAEPLRERLLELAAQARAGTGVAAVSATAEDGQEDVIVAIVPTGRLVASILISDVGFVAELIAIGLITSAAVSTRLAVAVLSAGLVYFIAAAQLLWTRFNQAYRLSVTETPDGLRIHSGLVALTTETIRPGRVQAVRMVEPLLWQLFGWCRLELDVAGRQRRKGEGRSEGRRLRAVLPVGTHAVAEELLDRILPDRPRTLTPPPRRARWKSPLRYRRLAYGRTDTCATTRSGRLRRVTCWVPLAKAQSFRLVQGPVQRRLGLASVHLDTAGDNVHAVARDRDAADADGVLIELVDLARVARARA